MNIVKQIIASLFLTLMLGMQFSALHHVTHDDDTATECDICLYSENVAQLDWQPATIIAVGFTVPVEVEVDEVDNYAFAKAEYFTIYYPTRPPPVTS